MSGADTGEAASAVRACGDAGSKRGVMLRAGAIAVALGVAAPAFGQQPPGQAPQAQPSEEGQPEPSTQPLAAYKPPLRGAPGGRVGGASRSAVRVATPLPRIELLAPADHTGLTASATPRLYYFVSRPVPWPMRFTISAPLQAAPVVDVALPPVPAAGIYPIHVGDYRARLRSGIVYTWSVAAVVDPHAWSRNIVASATIAVDPAAAVESSATPSPLRAARFAEVGLWYDAVAAAVDAQTLDRRAMLDSLIRQAGLTEAAAYRK